jgi:hypothetical protein
MTDTSQSEAQAIAQANAKALAPPGSNKALAAAAIGYATGLTVYVSDLVLKHYGLGELPAEQVSDLQGLLTFLLVYYTPHGGAK